MLSDKLNNTSLPLAYLLVDSLNECASGLSDLLHIMIGDSFARRSRFGFGALGPLPAHGHPHWILTTTFPHQHHHNAAVTPSNRHRDRFRIDKNPLAGMVITLFRSILTIMICCKSLNDNDNDWRVMITGAL